jgi:outer membrane protein OmpA-like peptidoglycan-associated protein
MRGARSAQAHEEEEESVFVSMTDMTISFLFILMILLAFFASQFSEDDKVPKPEYDRVVTQRNLANSKIEELTFQVTALKNELVVANKKNTQLESEIRLLKEQIQKLKEQIQKLKEQIKKLEELLNSLDKRDPLEKYLKDSAAIRKQILETLRDQLKIDFPTLDVIVNEQADALHFQGDGLFALNSYELSPIKRPIVEAIAKRLNEILPCYTTGPRSNLKDICNSTRASIEAVQIEGHTDSSGTPESNLQLSTQRANTTFTTMHAHARDLLLHKNIRNQSVLSVAGYGDMRPIADNRTEKGQATNRRIDLRIIMYTPSDLNEIQRIRDALNSGQPMVRVQ